MQHANISKLKAVYALVESSPGRQTVETTTPSLTPRVSLPMLKIYYLSVQIVQLLCCSLPSQMFPILEFSHVCSIRFLSNTHAGPAGNAYILWLAGYVHCLVTENADCLLMLGCYFPWLLAVSRISNENFIDAGERVDG